MLDEAVRNLGLGSEALIEPTVRGMLDELVDAWADGYGRPAREIPPACNAWAGRVMLADLEPRYADDPAALHELRRWTASWEAA